MESYSKSDIASLEAIGVQMQNGEEVGLPLQLKFLHWRVKTLSAQMKDDPVLILAHDSILEQIKAIDAEIMNLGDRGGPMIGQATLRDSRNNPW